MAGGRPRKYDYIKEAQDLDEWSKLNTSINLYGFTDQKPYLASQLGEFASVCEEFSVTLRKAKERLAARRERMVSEGKLHPSAWNRTVTMHDRMLYKHEEDTKDAEAERKVKIVAATPVNPMNDILKSIDGKTEELVGRSVDK